MEEPMLRELIAGGLLTILIGCLAAVAAQNTGNATPPPDPNQVRLVGDRFKPLAYAEMTPPQKKMLENLLAGERRGAGGPFNVLLRSPEMGDLAGTFGAATRFSTSIPRKLNELAIILVGRHWTSQFEWTAHHRAALNAGLSAAICDAIAEGKRPQGMAKDEEVVYNFVTELLNTTQMSDATFNATKAMFGERGIVDLIGVMGWYTTVSMVLNVDQYPLPDGQKPELKLLK
jgi:4-carboxymuconolactone decarboxylase